MQGRGASGSFFLFVVRFAGCFLFFFFNDTATTEIYTLSLHDALPIWTMPSCAGLCGGFAGFFLWLLGRSEEHTSELQSHLNLVCRLLLEKKKQNANRSAPPVRLPDTPGQPLRAPERGRASPLCHRRVR